MYSSIRELDLGNAYAKFGLGLQTAEDPPSGGMNPWGLSRALLTDYLASNVDLGSGSDAERRSLAKTTLDGVRPKFDKFQEEADGFDLHDGLRRAKQNGRWGFANETGEIVIAPRFEFERNFAEGLAPVRLNGKWGYIDRSGQFVIEPVFSDVRSFEQGVAKVTRQGDDSSSHRFIDRYGKFVPNPHFAASTNETPRDSAARNSNRVGTSEIGTFSGKEGGGSTVTVSLAPGKTFELLQRSDKITGTYEPMKLPFAEKAAGNLYFEFQAAMANGKPERLGSIIGFYSTKSDSFFLVDGAGAKDRLLRVGPHPEFAMELKREK